MWKNKYSDLLKLLVEKQTPADPAAVELAGTLFVCSVLGYSSEADRSTFAIIADGTWSREPKRT